MDNPYETYNLKEIKSIINQATELEMWEHRNNQEDWNIINDMKVRLLDMFGIFED